MKREDFNRSIRRAFSALLRLGVTSWDRVSKLASLDVDTRFRAVALDARSKYEDVYLTGLQEQHFNFILTDFSYFQFSCEGRFEIVQLRAAFYPNPFDCMGEEEFVQEYQGSADTEAALRELYRQYLAESDIHIEKPALRFEYAPAQYAELVHPASHMHIGCNNGSRLPIDKILTPHLFALFVARLFYPEQWLTVDEREDPGVEFQYVLDGVMAEEKRNCVELDRAVFSEKEKKHLHLS